MKKKEEKRQQNERCRKKRGHIWNWKKRDEGTEVKTCTHTGKMETYQQNDLMNMLQPDTTHRLCLRPSSCYKFCTDFINEWPNMITNLIWFWWYTEQNIYFAWKSWRLGNISSLKTPVAHKKGAASVLKAAETIITAWKSLVLAFTHTL